MYNKWIGSDKDVFKTRAFKLSIFGPVILAIGIGLFIHFNVTFGSFLSYIWLTMKLPIAIASLAIPLATWTIANHRSSQMIKTLNFQEEKRLFETYFEQESFFERIFGRQITNSKWVYITKEDLSVIHSKLYEFKRLKEKNTISICEIIEEPLIDYYKTTRKLFWNFYDSFEDEKIKDDKNIFLLDHLVHNFIERLHFQLMFISSHIGTRVLEQQKTSLPLLCTAYFEIYYLMQDLNIGQPMDEEDFNDDLEMFNAVVNVISQNYNIRHEQITIEHIQQQTSVREMVKQSTAKPIAQAVNRIMYIFSDHLCKISDDVKIREKSGEFISFRLFVHTIDDSINISFIEHYEGESIEGKLVMSYKGEERIADIHRLDGGYRIGQDEKTAKLFERDCIEFVLIYLKRAGIGKDLD